MAVVFYNCKGVRDIGQKKETDKLVIENKFKENSTVNVQKVIEKTFQTFCDLAINKKAI